MSDQGSDYRVSSEAVILVRKCPGAFTMPPVTLSAFSVGDTGPHLDWILRYGGVSVDLLACSESKPPSTYAIRNSASTSYNLDRTESASASFGETLLSRCSGPPPDTWAT